MNMTTDNLKQKLADAFGSSLGKSGVEQDKLALAGAMVSALHSAVQGSSFTLDAVPGLLKRVIKENLWQAHQLPRSHLVESHPTFLDFTKKALSMSIESLEKLCRDDAEALVLLREVTTNPNHRPISNNTVITSDNKQGNSKAYSLDRLKRDRPDLFAKVISNELSANSAMIQAGLRRQQFTVLRDPDKAAKTIKRHFSESECKRIAELLQGTGAVPDKVPHLPDKVTGKLTET
jgi:hypothetical protein